jgi:hypothetical protein
MLSPGLTQCKEEAALIGAMLANYGELEFCLTHCLGAVLGDINSAFKKMYVERGEERRIKTCEKMRPHFVAIKRESEFADTMKQVRHCKLIRDQYAHGWFSWSAFSLGWGEGAHSRKVTLKLVSLEDAVQEPAGIDAKPVNLPLDLVQAQAAYFLNAQDWILWLQSEIESAAGKPWSPTPSLPTRMPKPERWR